MLENYDAKFQTKFGLHITSRNVVDYAMLQTKFGVHISPQVVDTGCGYDGISPLKILDAHPFWHHQRWGKNLIFCSLIEWLHRCRYIVGSYRPSEENVLCHSTQWYIALLLQIMGFSWFLTTPTGLAMVLSIVWPRISCCVLFIRTDDLRDVLCFLPNWKSGILSRVVIEEFLKSPYIRYI